MSDQFDNGNGAEAPSPAPRSSRTPARPVAVPSPDDVIQVEGNKEFWEAWVDAKTQARTPDAAAPVATDAEASSAPSATTSRPRVADAAETGEAAEGGESEESRGRPRRPRRPRRSEGTRTEGEASADKAPEVAPGSQRLYLNFGRRDGADEAAVSALLQERGLATLTFDLHSTHTYLLVPDEQAEAVITVLNGQTQGERTLRCERARR